MNSLSPCRDKAGGNDEDDVTEINRHDVVVSPAVRAQIAAGRFSPPTGKTRCSFASSSEDSELHLAVEVVEGRFFLSFPDLLDRCRRPSNGTQRVSVFGRRLLKSKISFFFFLN